MAYDHTDAPGEELWFMNSWVTIRRPSRSAADGLCIMEHRLPQGDSPPLHVHAAEDEIFHILKGVVRYEVGGKTIIGRAGDTLVAPKGLPHSFVVESPEGAHVLTITTRADFETMLRAVSRPATAQALPDAAPPTPEFLERLVRVAAANGIDIIGPPLA
jgi:quercetin dioxygenase-like cupin family protein